MATRLYIAPAAAGKTTYALYLARDAAQGLGCTPRVIVPTGLQTRAWRRGLAAAGGAIGVRVMTFDHLYAEILSSAGEVYTELSPPVQYRLIRAVVDGLGLKHYAPLTDRPGFIQVLQQMIGELKANMIWPDRFADAIATLGNEPRLRELALIYTAYQTRLQSQRWADRAGMGWLAVEAMLERAPEVASDWPLLIVDGFDNLNQIQLEALRILSERVGDLIVTLTGGAEGEVRPFVYRRFNRTREQLEKALGVVSEVLPALAGEVTSNEVTRGTAAGQEATRDEVTRTRALVHLEQGLFQSGAGMVEAEDTVELIEAPDRATEVREGLRWLKTRLLKDGLRPGEVALLARSIPPYRPFIQQIANEFGLPIRIIDGLPLRSNPAVGAVLDLLRLMLPQAEDHSAPALPRRSVIEAWRSPYFDWSALPAEGDPQPIGIGPADGDDLATAARWGRVIGGIDQWTEVLSDLTGLPDDPAEDEDRGIPADLPRGPAAEALRLKFERFVRRLTPPQGKLAYRDYVLWLEELLGPDPALQPPRFPAPEEPTALQVVARARAGPEQVAERDVAALQALKDILRGLVWAEEAVTGEPVSFPRFLDELVGAIEAATYRLPIRPDREEVTVADVVGARGVPFRAVAVLGLAEGEFPATLGEDPFLRDRDRERLREQFELPLEPSTESAEAEFFYETVTRPSERLLLTRPRLTDNGAEWQPSPFWEEVRRLVTAAPRTLTSETVPPSDQAASWPELLESLASHPGYGKVRDWVGKSAPTRKAGMERAVSILQLRQGKAESSPYDGGLSDLAERFATKFGSNHTWSSSRLESYRTCPFFFFVGSVLRLEEREEPSEGLDGRQLGNIYHNILEQVYQAVDDPADIEQLDAALENVADKVLDEAPRQEGFRETAWWAQSREEIKGNVQRTLEALAEIQGDYVPLLHEAPFGLWDQPPLVVGEGEESFRVRGLIDRVDRAPGGQVRVIDYKTAGPYTYGKKTVVEGKRLQIPLYALAARDALGLGEPVEGFYWHVQHAEPSGFKLSTFDDGPEGAMGTAVGFAWEVILGARAGQFTPHPPADGCPFYCPAAGFCWHYRAGFGG
jgi:ATP-dependent helicase/DNAse subunit B